MSGWNSSTAPSPVRNSRAPATSACWIFSTACVRGEVRCSRGVGSSSCRVPVVGRPVVGRSCCVVISSPFSGCERAGVVAVADIGQGAEEFGGGQAAGRRRGIGAGDGQCAGGGPPQAAVFGDGTASTPRVVRMQAVRDV